MGVKQYNRAQQQTRVHYVTTLEITGDVQRTLTVWQEVRRLIMLWSNWVMWLLTYNLTFLSRKCRLFCFACRPNTEHMTRTINLNWKERHRYSYIEKSWQASDLAIINTMYGNEILSQTPEKTSYSKTEKKKKIAKNTHILYIIVYQLRGPYLEIP